MIVMLVPRFSFVVSTILDFFFVGLDGAVGFADGFGSSSDESFDVEFPSSALFIGAMADDVPGRTCAEVCRVPVPNLILFK